MRVGGLLWFLVVLAFLGAACSPSDDAQPTTTPPSSSVSDPTRPIETVSTTTTSPVDPVVAEIQAVVAVAVDSPEAAVAPGVLDGVDLDAGLPDGAVVTPVEGAIVVNDDVAEVLVDVTLMDGTTDQFVVVLVHDGSEWLIAYTVRLP